MTQAAAKLKQIAKLALDRNAKNCLFALMVEKLCPTYVMHDEAGRYVFQASSKIALERAKSLFSKEPDTIEWIKSFGKDEVLYDIGANVGAFSIYAAVTKAMKVYAFEPAFYNYYLLNRNICLNKLDNVLAFNIAFSNANHIDMLYMKTTLDGDSNTNVGTPQDCKKVKFVPEYSQPIICYTLDSFMRKNKPNFPSHIKIDVDGLEPEIIAGATTTINDKRLKSILVEVNEADTKNVEMVEMIKKAGFRIQNSNLSQYQADTFKNYIFAR